MSEASFESECREGTLLWQPDEQRKQGSNLSRYLEWLEREKGLSFGSYAELFQWSVADVESFWSSIVGFFDVKFHTPWTSVLSQRQMPGAHWFEGARLNYAEQALRRQDDHLAVLAVDETGTRVALSYAALSERVARARAGLRALGVGVGDRVAAFMPNIPETLICFLATASLGAVWSSCSPEFGVGSVLDRFRQIDPKVLLAVDGYVYNGKAYDRAATVEQIARGLPSLEKTVLFSRLGQSRPELESSMSLDQLFSRREPLTFEPVPFEHPLWVLYSSGTTGLPKPIVQGHGGIVLEHLKALSLHCDIKPEDRFFWFSTTGWMMWNFLISGLLLGSTVVLYDGSPAYPDLLTLWRLSEREQISYFGTSAPYLLACKKQGIDPKSSCDTSKIRSLGTTGAPLPPDGFAWVYQYVGQDVLLGSVSGGTDVCTAFVLSCPLLPVYAGEIQCAGLGCKVQAFDENGAPVVDQVGELVLTEPLPSMPLYFWGDDTGERYRRSYFSTFEGVWRHGDWIKQTPRDSFVIYGRSDATLNRDGVRMGTSEFYRVVDRLPELTDSLVVSTSDTQDASGKLWLFVVLAPGSVLDEGLEKKIAAELRAGLSPRHVPDEIVPIQGVPRTLSGKKLEVPIKRILEGAAVDTALNRDTLANPEAVEPFVELANKLRA